MGTQKDGVMAQKTDDIFADVRREEMLAQEALRLSQSYMHGIRSDADTLAALALAARELDDHQARETQELAEAQRLQRVEEEARDAIRATVHAHLQSQRLHTVDRINLTARNHKLRWTVRKNQRLRAEYMRGLQALQTRLRAEAQERERAFHRQQQNKMAMLSFQMQQAHGLVPGSEMEVKQKEYNMRAGHEREVEKTRAHHFSELQMVAAQQAQQLLDMLIQQQIDLSDLEERNESATQELKRKWIERQHALKAQALASRMKIMAERIEEKQRMEAETLMRQQASKAAKLQAAQQTSVLGKADERYSQHEGLMAEVLSLLSSQLSHASSSSLTTSAPNGSIASSSPSAQHVSNASNMTSRTSGTPGGARRGVRSSAGGGGGGAFSPPSSELFGSASIAPNALGYASSQYDEGGELLPDNSSTGLDGGIGEGEDPERHRASDRHKISPIQEIDDETEEAYIKAHEKNLTDDSDSFTEALRKLNREMERSLEALTLRQAQLVNNLKAKHEQNKRNMLMRFEVERSEVLQRQKQSLASLKETFQRQLDDHRAALQTERELRRMNEEHNHNRNEFLAFICHELRNPLCSVLGLMEIVLSNQDQELPVSLRKQLECVFNQTLLMQTIVNDVLDLKKIEAGMLALESVPFSVRDVVEDTILVQENAVLSNTNATTSSMDEEGGAKAHREAARANSKVTYGFRIHPDVPEELIGDPTRLRQVLLNLVSNARKFTPEGSIMLTAEVDSATKDSVVVLFSIKDTGIGIRCEDIPKLFKNFSQIRPSVSREYGGSGMGLSICRSLVTRMGGRIGVDSTEGVGSTFWFTVPLMCSKGGASSADADSSRSCSEERLCDRLTEVFSENCVAASAPALGVQYLLPPAAYYSDDENISCNIKDDQYSSCTDLVALEAAARAQALSVVVGAGASTAATGNAVLAGNLGKDASNEVLDAEVSLGPPPASDRGEAHLTSMPGHGSNSLTMEAPLGGNVLPTASAAAHPIATHEPAMVQQPPLPQPQPLQRQYFGLGQDTPYRPHGLARADESARLGADDGSHATHQQQQQVARNPYEDLLDDPPPRGVAVPAGVAAPARQDGGPGGVTAQGLLRPTGLLHDTSSSSVAATDSPTSTTPPSSTLLSSSAASTVPSSASTGPTIVADPSPLLASATSSGVRSHSPLSKSSKLGASHLGSRPTPHVHPGGIHSTAHLHGAVSPHTPRSTFLSPSPSTSHLPSESEENSYGRSSISSGPAPSPSPSVAPATTTKQTTQAHSTGVPPGGDGVSAATVATAGGVGSSSSAIGSSSVAAGVIGVGTAAAPSTNWSPSPSPRRGGGSSGGFSGFSKMLATKEQVALLEGIRVLVVDDSELLQGILKAQLERVGAVVELAANGKEAFQKAAAAPFHVIITDVNMPVMTGDEMARRLRRAGYRGIIIASTGNAEASDREQLTRAGINNTLCKPHGFAALVDMLVHYAPFEAPVSPEGEEEQ
eukprot:jgi/Mesvir1/21007/Mv08063-RA.2